MSEISNMIPKITIGVPVYGVEMYIERCAHSLFGQTYPNIEYIFVDDCSPDNSIIILLDVVSQYPRRKPYIKIIHHQVNKGLAAARNTVVESASGDFLLWVDSDDYIDKNLVYRCVSKQKEGDFDIVLFDFLILGKYRNTIKHHVRCNTTKERTIKLLARRTPVCVCAGLYRLSLYNDNDIIAVEGVNNNEDYQVSPRLSYYSCSTAYISEPLYFYDCTNPSSITRNFKVCLAEQGWKSITILEDFFRDKGKEYMNAIRTAAIARLANYMKWSVASNNKHYYLEMRIKQRNMNINLKEVCTLPFSYSIFLIVHNYQLLRLYFKMELAIKTKIIKIRFFRFSSWSGRN